MIKDRFEKIDGTFFDVIVIGAGATGASTAQHLIASGYKTLIIDKGDFASGTSSRSSRLLYCGLAHLSPDHPIWQFLLKPKDLARRLYMAHIAMNCRAQLVKTMPERLSKHTFFFPVFKNGQYPGWKVDFGFRLLELLGLFKVSLNYRRLKSEAAAKQYGLAKHLAANPNLESVGIYDEYQYQWAERICIDTILNAEDLGATILNYAEAKSMQQTDTGEWLIEITDTLSPNLPAIEVKAKMLINTAGPWVDNVIQRAGSKKGKDRVVGIKGVNLLVKLPEECKGQGLETISSIEQPYYCMPWGDYHFFGPTDTVFLDDPHNARVTDSDIEYVLNEANQLFPTFNLTPADIIHQWCGVRPRTAAMGENEIVKLLTIHELESDGLNNAIAVTGVPIMNHRYAAKKILKRVNKTLKPSTNKNELSFAARRIPSNKNQPILANKKYESEAELLNYIAKNEHVRQLSDLMFRRFNIGWEPDMGLEKANQIARTISQTMNWDEAEIKRQTNNYQTYVKDHFKPKVVSKNDK